MVIMHTPLLFALLCVYHGASGQAEALPDGKMNWWNDIPGFLNQQHEYSLAAAVSILAQNPPVLNAGQERDAAFLLLDNVFHEADAAKRPAVQRFFIERAQSVANALTQTKVDQGAVIWKLYNHGFIIRTPSATIAFDLVSGRHFEDPDFVLPNDLVEELARQCDVLFISHLHDDHADPYVAERFVRNGKTVCVPQGLWKDQSFVEGLLCLERTGEEVQSLPIRGGTDTLRVIIYPGHQGELLLNNVTLVTTAEGLTFAQIGDQSNDKDFAWIDQVAKAHRVDVLMPNCWSPDLSRLIRGFDPVIVIPGHENELSHSVDHREPYWLDGQRMGEEAKKAILMAWGERYTYPPK